MSGSIATELHGSIDFRAMLPASKARAGKKEKGGGEPPPPESGGRGSKFGRGVEVSGGAPPQERKGSGGTAIPGSQWAGGNFPRRKGLGGPPGGHQASIAGPAVGVFRSMIVVRFHAPKRRFDTVLAGLRRKSKKAIGRPSEIRFYWGSTV